MLHLLFGDTVLAVSTVLASFMAGLALGSFWSGRYVDRRPRVLALYAGLEAGIGVSAVVLPVVLQALTPLYVWLHQYLHASFWLFSVVRFFLAFSLLFVPTTLMGATLPVLSRYMVRNTATLGWRVGTLYALNTGGAVLGCFLAGYVLIGRFGRSPKIYGSGTLNLAIALVVWVVQRYQTRALKTRYPEHRSSQAAYVSRKTVRRVLWIYLSGLRPCSRSALDPRLTFFIGNSTYAQRHVDNFPVRTGPRSLRPSATGGRTFALFGAFQVGIGAYGVLTIAILGRLFYGLDTWWEGFSNAYWGTALWLTFVKTFVVILPPTLCMGGIFPLVSKIVAHGPQVVGRSIGNAYAYNTLGAIVGSWVSGFVTIPLLGMHNGSRRSSVGVGASSWRMAPSRAAAGDGCIPACWGSLPLLWWPRPRFADIAEGWKRGHALRGRRRWRVRALPMSTTASW
jgi:spermidine synthase